ncbi:hypothetical protein BN1051_00542 [Arthrobacter saudimassiliensis]|uniref:Uncharacterized protein n=1 Tax=Arthrobacter saudimassiliensis TaxID=1461584 RepID=A0A078MLQ7_9MICC|nr:hypothetical protein BN1051_00542 [Arthrobacter saudimassiliensis]
MPQPVDVGSVLGGRYKVTAQVLASAENDLVLDGVDQVLNRPVSILLAAPANASQVTASAREIATGEREANVQVLDLGISDGQTYLVTSEAHAADLLDLVIERDAPFVEPFFTDTLGSEIFGMPRSREPEPDDSEDIYVDVDEDRPKRPLLPHKAKARMPRFGRSGDAGAAAAAAGSGQDLEYGGVDDAPAEAATGAAAAPPPPSVPPRREAATSAMPAAAPAAAPAARAQSAKVSQWEDERTEEGTGDARRPSNFPRSAMAGTGYDDSLSNELTDDDADEDTSSGGKRTGRLIVGGVLSLVLILAVVFAVGNLGRLGDMFSAAEQAAPETSAAPEPAAPSDGPAAEPAPAPVVAGVSRLVPGNQQLDSVNDGALPRIIDGDPASFWSSYVYANDTFGGLAPSLALVVELEQEAAVNAVEITQLNGTGGNFTVMLNNEPTLDGARTVAQSGFSGSTTTIQVPEQEAGDGARYVIINFTQLPRLSGVQAEYPWGLRISEISVS